MFSKLLSYKKGYVRLKITGAFTERFINICMARRISVWDIEKTEKNVLFLSMYARDFLNIRPVAKKTRCKVKIISKHGLFVSAKKYKKRKLFFIGAVVFFLFLLVMSRFVWYIEIDGVEKNEHEALLMLLKEEGVSPGVLKSKIDQRQVKDKILLKRTDLSWIWVDLKGTKALVSVTKKTLPPEAVNRTDPCDIIAEKDGIILSVTSLSGNPTVKEGDSVFEGQVLISSVVPSEIILPRYTHAEGEVWARTWYSEEATFSPMVTSIKKTVNKKAYNTISIFGFDINLFFKKSAPFAQFEEEKKETPFILFGLDTGIKLKKTYLHELKNETKELNEEELLAYAENELFKKIEKKLSPSNKKIAHNITHIKNPDGSYKISLTAEYEEQIGKVSYIDNPLVPQEENL